MDVRILKFVAQNLNINTNAKDYNDYELFATYMTPNEEMLDYLFEEGYVTDAPLDVSKFTKKALDILNEENK
jgi:hypothetical protein